jgi:ribulose-5-phosphate 4-epimerase/fuculose-1-phosphate aldolase
MTSTSTAPTEGAIRFRYRLNSPRVADALDAGRFERLAAWRRILKQLKLVGRDRRRYDGYAYGNLSVRDTVDPARFYVTASQTSGAPRLVPQHVVRVDDWDAERFEVDATGTLPPSSESITHGIAYAADPAIAWIMHVHAPVIWRSAARLQLPLTAADVPYGSPAMAEAVAALAQRDARRPLVFATLGHEDGVFACGATADDTGAALVRTLADALAGSRR